MPKSRPANNPGTSKAKSQLKREHILRIVADLDRQAAAAQVEAENVELLAAEALRRGCQPDEPMDGCKNELLERWNQWYRNDADLQLAVLEAMYRDKPDITRSLVGERAWKLLQRMFGPSPD